MMKTGLLLPAFFQYHTSVFTDVFNCRYLGYHEFMGAFGVSPALRAAAALESKVF